jgi:nucleoside-diphosphate-sugar epimerase
MDNTIIYRDAEALLDRVELYELQGKRILITGATGLIGTYLLYTIREFVKRGNSVHSVIIVANQELPEHLKELEKASWLDIIRGDLSDLDLCRRLPRADYIIHAAGYGQPARFSIDQAKTIKLNTCVTFALLDRLTENGKFLFISSSGIYSGLQKEKFCETDVGTTNTMHPRACYIEGKRCGEAICNAYRAKGINAKSARVSYTYGPGVRGNDTRALYNFIQKGFKGDIRLLDDGSAQRIYCYVADVVEILWDIILKGKEPIYNVGGTEGITIRELAQLVADRLKILVILPEQSNAVPGNAAIERLDISKVVSEFHKTDFIDIHNGVERTIEWYSQFQRTESARAR